MGIFGGSKTVPNANAKSYVECEKMLEEVKPFAKALGSFTSQLHTYESATYKLAAASRGLVAGHTKERTAAIKNQLTQQLSTGVYTPIKDFLTLYKTVLAEFKDLDKKCTEYSKSEKQLEQAKSKKAKAEATGAVAPEKQAKMTQTCQKFDTSHELAKNAYMSAAPQVEKDCRLLLQKRDELRANIFSAFKHGAEALNTIAGLKSAGNAGTLAVAKGDATAQHY